MIHDPTQPDKPGSLIVASRKTSFLLSFPLAAQLEPVSPSTPHGSPIETDPDLPSLTSTSTGSLNLSSEQLGILTITRGAWAGCVVGALQMGQWYIDTKKVVHVE
ncbi:uncharacterized protein EI90DRAFT_3116695 [Cantharellus anzutake]|uniref:uncharacterized protein n=1 Tax=Cantharellus anzutake TaxID=1750568 RepID=UPI0019066B3A|nr:uncharacterized protein EI90DRAFT_3116695 [Cantharellus anzutake]KAF8341599.1 hypothetical protein EI90DRAFT_3116695 [Cantharellus anzutake]